MSWIRSFGRFVGIYLVAPLAMLLFLLGGSLLLVASPPVWKTLYSAPEKLGQHAQMDGELIAENLWTVKPYKEVSNELQGRRLNQREIVHYEDLQVKFRTLKGLVFVCGLLSLVSLCFQWRMRAVVASLSWLAAICAIGGVWSAYNWRGMFRALHWWIFQDDSWILPKSSYSLKLYPYSVWKEAMLWMIVLSALGYLIFWLLCTILNKRLATK